ncbi:MAG: hypothetical protein IPP53_07035 [Bacteroidetes bacterium]|nr:hypothetical protein [Bacteroidota bacterium]
MKKKPNDENPLPLHQDWTVTDEENTAQLPLFPQIPLQDTFKRMEQLG